MKYIHTQKFVRISPTKIRPLARLIKKMNPLKAMEVLPLVRKRAAVPLLKTIKAAVANARNQGADDSSLIINELQIGEGPRLKKGRPVSRGLWHPYKRRMSHIRIVLEDKIKDDEKKSHGIEEKKTEKRVTKKVQSKTKRDKKDRGNGKKKVNVKKDVKKTVLKKGKEK